MDTRRTLLMGVIEPYAPATAPIELAVLRSEGERLVEQGVDIVDIDAVSGAGGLAPDGEHRDHLARLVVALMDAGAQVSVTTTSADVAVLAADHGAAYVIDPSGGVADPFMAEIVAASQLGFVVGQWAVRHASGHHAGAAAPSADEFVSSLERRIDALLAAGVASERLVIDSGAGLAVGGGEEWRMLDHLRELGRLGRPLLVNASRPRLLASLLPDDADQDARDAAALAISVLGVGAGAWAVRVRNVARTAHALKGLLRA